MATPESETPLKMCLTAIEKKVRNLEKRKGKLDSYKEKMVGGEELNKDQKEAIAKYEVVTQNLEFARDLQKQFQVIGNDAEKVHRKQAKREKSERQQGELVRLQELLRLQTLLDSLGDDAIRQSLQRGNADLVVSDDCLEQLDTFYQLIAPSRDEGKDSFVLKLAAASEHLQSYLDRVDRPVAGTTYLALHDLIENIDASHCLDSTSVPPVNAVRNQQTASVSEQDESPAHSTSDLAALTLRNMSPVASSTDSSILPSDPPVQPPPSAVVNSTSDQGSPALSYHALDSQWVSSHSDALAAAAATQSAAVYNSSYFGGAHQGAFGQRTQRPLHDIVSSMQGSFHFLQESQIEHDMSARPPSNPGFVYGTPNSGTPPLSQYTVSGSESPRHLSTGPGYHQQPTTAFYGPQRASPAFGFVDQHPAGAPAPPSAFLVSQAEETCPAPIPLPSEVTHGQSLTVAGFESQQLSTAALNDAMNANSNAFRTVYDATSSVAGMPVQAPVHRRPVGASDMQTSGSLQPHSTLDGVRGGRSDIARDNGNNSSTGSYIAQQQQQRDVGPSRPNDAGAYRSLAYGPHVPPPKTNGRGGLAKSRGGEANRGMVTGRASGNSRGAGFPQSGQSHVAQHTSA